MVASNFHERSYADRLEEQRANYNTLVTLYAHSTDQVGLNDTLHDAPKGEGGQKPNALTPDKLLKNVLKGVRGVAQTTTQAFGNIASEIMGTSVLQPNSPGAMVANALNSPNKTRLLARRLFYSFKASGSQVLLVENIEQYFPNHDAAVIAFAFFRQGRQWRHDA